MNPEPRADLSLEGLVHDLNNVFETISDAADLLADDARWKKVAAALHRSARRGERIVSSFVETTRGSVELADALNRSIDFARDFLSAARRPEIGFDIATEAGIRLKGSPGAWERVFVNLFLNAGQAMKQGGSIHVRAQRVPTGIEVSIADEGPGIAPEILPEIFKPHFSTKSARRGTFKGLGLHIVESVVRQNGGAVTAGNRTDGCGAVFTILLPEN
ncbi:MAG: HAMP domain-containing histidine kinase [Acidobacteria bacterium]|nr:HAMP domain-containing histidine kinase [Acidobacteriota bacterium]